MPLRIEHFDIVLHAFKCLMLSPGPSATSEQSFSMSQQNEYFVVKLCLHPRSDANKSFEQT